MKKSQFVINVGQGKTIVVQEKQKTAWESLKKNKDLEKSIQLLSLE